MKLKTITVTGADNSVTPGDLISIQAAFPEAEFGILMSEKQAGNKRFPDEDWIKNLQLHAPALRLSAHICGEWVRQFFLGVMSSQMIDQINGFKRIQLNTHGVRHKFNEGLIELVAGFNSMGIEIIFQHDNKNLDALETVADLKVSALFDLSHGAGVLPASWPAPLAGIRCGYAGGLSPENVAEQVRKIAMAIEAKNPILGERVLSRAEYMDTFWIDAETHLRSKDDARLDLDKVRAFLHNAKNA